MAVAHHGPAVAEVAAEERLDPFKHLRLNDGLVLALLQILARADPAHVDLVPRALRNGLALELG